LAHCSSGIVVTENGSIFVTGNLHQRTQPRRMDIVVTLMETIRGRRLKAGQIFMRIAFAIAVAFLATITNSKSAKCHPGPDQKTIRPQQRTANESFASKLERVPPYGALWLSVPSRTKVAQVIPAATNDKERRHSWSDLVEPTPRMP
jgi:hypothetical protein